MKIPILSLGSEPVIVNLSGLHIVAGPKHRESASDAEERDRLERTKKRRLQLADLLGLDQPIEEEDEETKVKRLKKAEEENDSVLGKLKMKILNNIQVKIENIHIRYQDDLSNPENPFALGITLDELYAESADENWVPGWIKRTKSTIIRKLVRLQNLCIYFDTPSKPGPQTSASNAAASSAAPGIAQATAPVPTTSAPTTISGPVAPMLRLPQGPNQSAPQQASVSPQKPPTAVATTADGKPIALPPTEQSELIYKFANDQQMCKVLTALTYKKSRAPNQQPAHNYILAPFSAQLKLVLDISEDMANFTRPKVQVDTKVEDIQLALNQAQFFGALDLFQYFSLYINSLKYLSLRPAQLNDKTLHLPENRSKLARLRWSYVIACVRHDVRQKVDSWSWSSISQRKKDRIAYTEIFKRIKSGKKVEAFEEEQVRVLEKTLHYEDIIVYRKLAYAAIIHDKKKKRRKRDKEPPKPAAVDPKKDKTPSKETKDKDKDKAKEKEKEKSKAKEKEKPKEEESILDRLFGFTKSDKEKERDRQRALEKAEKERRDKIEKERRLLESKGVKVAPTEMQLKAHAQELAQSPQHQDVSTAVHLAPVAKLDAIDEDELLKELYESIGFDNSKQAEHSDYPKDYIHTKLSFHVVKGRLHLTEVDPKLPVVATFSFSNVYTGIRLSGVSSLNLDGYVESCDMLEYHTLGGPTKPFPVVQRDESQHGPDAPLQHIFSFTVGTNTISPSSQSADPVDLDLSILALPLLITISRPFIDRMLVFFDLYGRDDISEHLSELAEKSFESMKQRAEAQLKYALGARKTLLVNAIVHAPRIQIPSDYTDPFSPVALLDLGIITVMADTTSRPDSKVALSRVKALREIGPIPKSASPTPGSNDLSLSHIDENYFFDRIVMKLSGINAGIVRKRTSGEPRHPPPKDSPDIIALLSKVDASITLSICNTQTHDLARARIDANITMLRVHANKAIMGIIFDVVRTAVNDTRPVDPVREAEIAEKARLRRLQLILWSEDLGEEAPALHALLNGMDAVNRRRQNLAAFLDFDDSETETDTESTGTDTESVDFSESEEMSLAESFGSARSTMHTSRSNTSLSQVKDRLRTAKVKPAKKQFEFKLIEAHFQLDGISVGLAEMLEGVEYPVVTLSVNQLKAQLNASDQSLALSTSLLSFAIQEHITERTSFGNAEIAKGDHYIIRSTAPPGMALIDIGYEQLDRRCSRYNNLDHNVKLSMQGLEVTVSRLTMASLIVVATELATSIQSAMGLAAKSSIVDLSLASSHPELRSSSPGDQLMLPPPVSTILAGAVSDDSESEDSSAAATFTDDNISEQSEIEDMRKRESKKAAQLAMVKAAVQEGIELAHIELSLKEVVVQLNKEGSPFFKTTISNAKAEVGIFPDHTTQVQGSLSDVRCSARSNEAGVPIWTVERATSEVPFVPAGGRDASPIDGTKFAPPPSESRAKLSTSTTAVRTPYEWTDIIYVDEDCFGSFSLKVYDPSMPNYPGVDMDVKAAVGGLRAVVLFRIVDEIITYLTAFKSMLGVIGYLQAAQSNDEPEPKTRMTIEVSTPIIFIPRSTESREFISVSLGETMITNRLDTIAGVKYDFMTINVKGLGISAVVRNSECTGLVERRILENLDLCLSVNRAIEGNDDHLLPDVEVSSSIEQIRIHVAASDLLLIPGLLSGNFSEFVLRKDEIELKEAISFLESINLIQFISNIVPLSEVTNLSNIPYTKVRVSFAIAGVNATLYRGSGVLENGDDSALLSGIVSTLDIGVIVTSDEGVQLSMNIDRIEVLDCSRNTPNKFRYVLFPNHGFETAQSSSLPTTPRTPTNSVLARRLSVSSGMSSSSRSRSISVSGPLGRSSALQRPNPFFKLRYEDRPSELIEFVTVTLSHPRIYIVPHVLEELLGIFIPFVTSIVSALDTWHQRLIFGSEAEQRDVLANALTSLETRHREEIAQLIAQHRNNISTMRSNKKSSPKDEEVMMMAQESTRKLVLERQKQELQDLRQKGIVPKWTNPNEMRVKVEINNPEICIVERSTAQTSPSFVISLGHVILRISVLPELIDIEPNVSDIGIYKATLDSGDAAGTTDNVMLLQPFDLTGSVRVRPPSVKQPSGLADIVLTVGLIHTIVSYRDVRLGVEVFRSFEPMINKIITLASDLGAVAEEAAKLMVGQPRDDLVLQIGVKQMLFSLLNDHNPLFVVPVAKVNLGDVQALVQTNETKNITLQVPHLTAAGFNNALSSYEPLIEPWSFDVKILERGNTMTIPIAAQQRPLNINVTRSLFDAIFGIIAFADDMKALLSPDENVRILKKGAAAASASPYSYDDTWENSSSRSGVISSPKLTTSASSSTPQKAPPASINLNDFIGHQRKPSSSLAADQLGSLGDDENRGSPGPAGLAGSTSAATTGAERSFDPFLVRNDTNESLRVWKSSERPDSGFVLAPGQQMSLRSQKSSKHAADTAFYVNVDITIGTSILALEHIPIEKVHSQVYSLRNDRSVKILSEVTLQHGTKILTLSTVHYIRNSTTETLEVMVVSPSGTKHEMTIPSQQTRSIPIRFCDYKEIKLRPLGGYLWYTRHDKSADGIVNCYSDDRNSNRSWSCCLTYSSRVIEGGKDYCIHLSPQLILENLLCSHLLIKTYTPAVKISSAFSNAVSSVTNAFSRSSKSSKPAAPQEEDEVERKGELAFTIDVGDQLPVFAAQAADSVVKQTYRIQIPGCSWSDNLDMGELFSHQKVGFSFERALTLQDVAGRQILIYVLVNCPSPGCMRVSFFSKYWIINQTGLCLAYRTNSKSNPQVYDPRSISMIGNPREWYKDGLMSELAAQRTYYSTGEISMMVMATNQTDSSPWSNTFTLEQKEEEQVQPAKVETVTITDPKQHRIYTFKMEIANAPGKHWRTKEVRISPAFMLINKTDLTLWYDQFTGAKLKARSPTCFDLKPGERVPFHWSQTKSSGKRLIFTTDEAYNATRDPMQVFWSIPFRLTQLDSFIVKIRTGPSGPDRPPGSDHLIKVQIIERSNVLCVVFRNATQDIIPFYKIDNRTNLDMFAEQGGVGGSLERVPPRSIQNWYWENPLESPDSRHLSLRLVDGSSLSVPYKASVDRSIVAEGGSRGRLPTMNLPPWEVKIKNVPTKVRVRLIQQGFVKILCIDMPSFGNRPVTMLGQTQSAASSPDLSARPDDSNDILKPEDKSVEVSVSISGIGISIIDNFRARLPNELVYATLLGIEFELESSKQVHQIKFMVKKFQVDNQMKFAPEPVAITSVRAPLRGAKRASDFAPFLATTLEIDSSEETLVYIREMRLELQVLDVSVDQQFILAMTGFGEALGKYIAVQSGLEQSVQSRETTLPTIEDAELLAPNVFVQSLNISPVKLVLSLVRGVRLPGSAPPIVSAVEAQIKRYTDILLKVSSLQRITVQLGAFGLERVNASGSDLGARFGQHYRGEGFANISKVVFNYLSLLKLFTSDPPPRSPIRLPRYFPVDYLVVPYNISKAYGQKLLVDLANGKFANDVYLFHIWLGNASTPVIIFATSERIVVYTADRGVLWEERMETFVDIQITKPPEIVRLSSTKMSASPLGEMALFFDKEAHVQEQDHKHTLQLLPVEQMTTLERSFRAISKEKRSTSQTINNANLGQSLTSSWS